MQSSSCAPGSLTPRSYRPGPDRYGRAATGSSVGWISAQSSAVRSMNARAAGREGPVAVPGERDAPRRDLLVHRHAARTRSSVGSAASSGTSADGHARADQPLHRSVVVAAEHHPHARRPRSRRNSSVRSPDMQWRKPIIGSSTRSASVGASPARASGASARRHEQYGSRSSSDGLVGPRRERQHGEAEVDLAALQDAEQLRVGGRLGQRDLDPGPLLRRSAP